jgi:hypothetical protein
VAGWVSKGPRWSTFDADWRIALASFNVPYLHMREFAHSTGPFSSWRGQESKRIGFLQTLIDVIGSSVDCGIGMLLPMNIFASVNKIFRVSEELGNAFTACALMCIIHGQRVKNTFEMEYYFECGDVGRSELQRVLTKHGHPLPTFQPSRDQGEVRGATPLQAADLLAYELLKSYKIGEFEPEWKHRQSAKHLHSKVPGDYKRYNETDLIQFCLKLGITQRAKQSVSEARK